MADRKSDFPVERAVFVTTLNLLFSSGSDRFCAIWMEDYGIKGADELNLHHCYCAMARLGEELSDQESRTLARVPGRLLKKSCFWAHQSVFILRLGFL